MKRIISTALFVIFLSGCSIIGGENSPFRNRSNDYLQAEAIDVIAIPDDLSREAIGQLYPVPDAGEVPSYQLNDEFEVPRVQPNLDQANVSGVKIQRLGDENWILASSPPGETWPRVRNFLSDNSMSTEFANASTGTIDTGWVELADVEGLVHQFRLRLEQGVQLNTTEIVIQHRQYQVEALPPVIPEWPEQGSDDQEQEEWMQSNLAEALATDDVTSSASLLGQEIGAAIKVILETPEQENPYMILRLNETRAWASIEYALGTDTFNILLNDGDTDIADFEFYETEPEDISWFSALFGKRNPEPEVFKLIMVEEDGNQVIRIYDSEGNEADARDAYMVLSRLRNNLT